MFITFITPQQPGQEGLTKKSDRSCGAAGPDEHHRDEGAGQGAADEKARPEPEESGAFGSGRCRSNRCLRGRLLGAGASLCSSESSRVVDGLELGVLVEAVETELPPNAAHAIAAALDVRELEQDALALKAANGRKNVKSARCRPNFERRQEKAAPCASAGLRKFSSKQSKW